VLIDNASCQSCVLYQCTDGSQQPEIDCTNIEAGAVSTACGDRPAGGFTTLDDAALNTSLAGLAYPFYGCLQGTTTLFTGTAPPALTSLNSPPVTTAPMAPMAPIVATTTSTPSPMLPTDTSPTQTQTPTQTPMQKSSAMTAGPGPSIMSSPPGLNAPVAAPVVVAAAPPQHSEFQSRYWCSQHFQNGSGTNRRRPITILGHKALCLLVVAAVVSSRVKCRAVCNALLSVQSKLFRMYSGI
jgi:hypothetical protein